MFTIFSVCSLHFHGLEERLNRRERLNRDSSFEAREKLILKGGHVLISCSLAAIRFTLEVEDKRMLAGSRVALRDTLLNPRSSCHP